MITNNIKQLAESKVSLPVIIKSEGKGWIPTFELWETLTSSDTSIITSQQRFNVKSKKYSVGDLDPEIGFFDYAGELNINWKTLVDTISLGKIGQIYSGALRATHWRERNVVYFGTGSDKPWLHTIVFENDKPEYVVHHINLVSQDNRKKNLQLLPKKEHDSIRHVIEALDSREKFKDPATYWEKRRELEINDFLVNLASILTDESQANFIGRFAEGNIDLVKEILKIARLNINLSQIRSGVSENRLLNPHLDSNYLDAYETQKYLKQMGFKKKTNAQTEGQMSMHGM